MSFKIQLKFTNGINNEKISDVLKQFSFLQNKRAITKCQETFDIFLKKENLLQQPFSCLKSTVNETREKVKQIINEQANKTRTQSLTNDFGLNLTAAATATAPQQQSDNSILLKNNNDLKKQTFDIFLKKENLLQQPFSCLKSTVNETREKVKDKPKLDFKEPRSKNFYLTEFKKNAETLKSQGVYLKCQFCFSNNEEKDVYSSHRLRSLNSNVVECPILRGHICPTCKATGDKAHTMKYCQEQKYKNLVESRFI